MHPAGHTPIGTLGRSADTPHAAGFAAAFSPRMLRCTSGARVDLLSATVSSGHLTAPLVLNFPTSGDLGRGTAMASHPALLRRLS
jgi:hypothetical protein